MASIDKEITINARPEKIYNFVIKASNLPQLWPSLSEVKNEKLLPNGGYSADWKYRMAGIYLTGTSKCTEVVPNKWFTVKISGMVESSWTWTFRARDYTSTRVTVTVEYHTSLPIINRLAEPVINKMNEHEADLVLANLRVIMEETNL